MPGFKLQTPESELVGFLMLEGKEPVGTGTNPRDCIFMSVPARFELAEHELNLFLTEYRTTEFCCSFSHIGEQWELTIPIDESALVRLCWADEGNGMWEVQGSGDRLLTGKCQLLSSTQSHI